MSPTKSKKDVATVVFSQEEAKDLALKLAKLVGIEQSIGDHAEAVRTNALRAKVIEASGKVPDA